MEYILVLWPYSQEFMEYEWFLSEAYLCEATTDENTYYSSAYFIPKERYMEVMNIEQ